MSEEHFFLPRHSGKTAAMLEHLLEVQGKHPDLRAVESTTENGDFQVRISFQGRKITVIGPRDGATIQAVREWFIERTKKQLEEDTGGT